MLDIAENFLLLACGKEPSFTCKEVGYFGSSAPILNYGLSRVIFIEIINIAIQMGSSEPLRVT